VFVSDNGNDDDSMQTIKTDPEGRKCERARAGLSVKNADLPGNEQ